jgi:N-acetylmuramoyl-L-alanine amidase
VKKVGRKDRGVKQAGYYVISFTNMPSILIELGFLTNPEEEDFLHSDEGKTHMASAIFRAFKAFYGDVDGEVHSVESSPNTKPAPSESSFNPQSIVYRPITKGVRYQVQIMSSDVPLKSTDKVFKGIEKVDHYEYNGVFKYLAGSTGSYSEAKAMQDILKNAGFKDAFLVAFEDNRRIELGIAVQKTGK